MKEYDMEPFLFGDELLQLNFFCSITHSKNSV